MNVAGQTSIQGRLAGIRESAKLGLISLLATKNKGSAMKLFRLYVKLGNKWEMVCTVQAPDREAAKREAIVLVKPEDRSKPLRLVEDNQPVPS